MPFGEIVCGSPGSGKSTYCQGKHQLFTALHRRIYIINLDPANEDVKYPCAVDIGELVKLEGVMEEYGLGPNGGMLYCVEYLERNFDWLEERVGELGKGVEGEEEGEVYVLFDLPGQVELSTSFESMKRIVDMLQTKCHFRLAAVHLCDAHYITDASKYISILLLSLRTMLQLELPQINVLSKIDLLSNYGELEFNLDYYTQVQDLEYLENSLMGTTRFRELNKAMMGLVEDYGLVGFETLAVEDKGSMVHLMHVVDRATGYVFMPNGGGGPRGSMDESDKPMSARANEYGLFTSAAGPLRGNDIGDVQERWVDAKDAWDAYEKKQWRKEGEINSSLMYSK
ncbi:hypothetical protein GGU10DRAFT_77175 [Lentinula aff. detonsa]|uniref:GPN-loop GTPase 2 n=1 Tax=Lentinula aff. detonsa TaxID=2804958 RepID=A0AA38KUS1_9AGAR|nr:hypothetical protein GGU10DRAFT_77175 [Lentinula aff. detonsa]